MAQERRLKQLHFNLEDPDDRRLYEFAQKRIGNFSGWGKRHLAIEMERQETVTQPAASAAAMDQGELAELVQALVKAELAGHLVVTDQLATEGGVELPNIEGYF